MNDYYSSEISPVNEHANLQVQSQPQAQVQSQPQLYAPKSAQAPVAGYRMGPSTSSSERRRRHRRPRHLRQRYNDSAYSMDAREILKRGLKYIIEGLAVAVVAYLILKNRLELTAKDILILGFTAAFTFAILDTFSPSVSLGARFGAGFGLGTAMVGPGMVPLAVV